MFRSRTSTTYAMLAALLLSNVAGWIHVGCGHHHPLAVVAEPSADHVACCCHGHGRPAESSCDDDAPVAPTNDHDSDDCSVCHSFFASRHAILSCADAVVWSPVATQRLRLERDVAAMPCVAINNTLVRGPPSV